MQKADIKKIVKEVLKQNGIEVSPAPRPTAKHTPKSRPSPVVLNVFNPGVRKLEQALEQVRLIEEIAAKSSVFTVNSARQWVCGDDVKQKAGSRCILDNVNPQGLEKVILNADLLVLPTFCFKTAAKVARLIGDDQASAIVLSALTQGKPVLATRDGFALCEALVNEGIRSEIESILAKLKNFGMIFCTTEQLCEVFIKITSSKPSQESDKGKKTAHKNSPAGLKLVTAKDIQIAANNKQQTIQLMLGGIITPLAVDQAKEYGIRILKNGSRPI